MKLWYSNSSPYARKARAVVQYHQLQDHVELLLASSGLDKNSPHNLDLSLIHIYTGSYDTSTIEKKARLVVTIEYAIE